MIFLEKTGDGGHDSRLMPLWKNALASATAAYFPRERLLSLPLASSINLIRWKEPCLSIVACH